MQILLIGKGAREHALAWKLSQSPKVSRLYLWPGNPAMEKNGHMFPLPSDASYDDLAKKAKELNIELTICGPEVPLSQGIADRFLEWGLKFFGPVKEAARLESSKSFAKDIMAKAGIPTAESNLTLSRQECLKVATEYLYKDKKVVLKADGLAAGKGVRICDSTNSLNEAISHYYDPQLEETTVPVLVERFLSGRECSWFALLGTGEPLELGFAVDFKRVSDGDLGPNTGGMGSYTPVPWLPKDASDQIQTKILSPLLKELSARKIHYTGFLYIGLIWDQTGPRVIEYNVRLGDPEAQVLAVQDSRDWLDMIYAKASADVGRIFQKSSENSSRAVGIVMASPMYPDPETSDAVERIIPDFHDPDMESVQVFAASVRKVPKGFAPGTGRVLTVVAKGSEFNEARLRALKICDLIKSDWPEAKWRSDIGLKVSLEEDNHSCST